MKTLIRFLRDRRAVSPVIGTILMVAITVVMAAIVGGFVYQTGKPKSSPQLSTTLEDDVRVTLTALGADDTGRVAKLLMEGGARVTASELLAIVTYTDAAEFTVTLDGGSWPIAPAAAVSMGTVKIKLQWVDSDNSTDVSPGDRLDFFEGGTNTTAGSEVAPNSDFTVKIVHKSSEATLAAHTIRVY